MHDRVTKGKEGLARGIISKFRIKIQKQAPFNVKECFEYKPILKTSL